MEGTGITPEPPQYDISATFNMDSLQAGKMLSAEVSVTNLTDVQEAVLVIVALYDEDNRMVNLSYVSKEIGARLTEKLNGGFILPNDIKNHKVQVFVWDGTDLKNTNMRPLS